MTPDDYMGSYLLKDPLDTILDRLMDNRCPMCGSRNCNPGDYTWDAETGEEYGIGVDCDDCDYWNDGNAPMDDGTGYFVYPGEPGSCDQPDDPHFE
jgi:hypothetical protein